MLHSIDAAKAHEIMARFRPIAPKPAPSPDSPPPAAENPRSAALSLRSRPCRARKRGRGASSSSSVILYKRPRSFLPVQTTGPPPLDFGCKGFAPFSRRDPLALSLLPCSPSRERGSIPVERDLLQMLQEPCRIIVPQPVRPVGSSIRVIGCISHQDTTASSSSSTPVVPKKPEEVEEEVEAETLPAVVSDCNNRVRLANSAYKELVGQPECPWLELMVSGDVRRPGLKRISGEVTLDLTDSSEIPPTSEGFSCRAKIQWACNGRSSSIDVPCDVIRLYCDSKNYLFTWRFNTTDA